MNRADFILATAKAAGTCRTDAERVLNAAENIIISALSAGERVQLTGFGAFESRFRAARRVRNPSTGEMMSLSATTVPTFKPGKGFKKAVSGAND